MKEDSIPNILEEWKKECYFLSSQFNYKKNIVLERSDVDSVYSTLKDYFGSDYFVPKDEPNWIHYLLANCKIAGCIAAIFEIANLLLYLKKQSHSLQNKFKSVIKDPHQFRNLFFELYVYRLLEYNHIETKKKLFEGKKELEGTCLINNKEFLFECMKLYGLDIKLLESIKSSLENLLLGTKKLNKGVGLIGTIIFNDPNNVNSKTDFQNKLELFIEKYNESTFNEIDYHHNDSHSSFSVVSFSTDKSIEIENDSYKYHVVFKIVPPLVLVPGILNHYTLDLKAAHSFPQWKVTRKLISSIERKRAQHVNSKYSNKIYFIDSESIPDFELPIFKMDSMFEEAKLTELISNMSENEIVCIIRRDYSGDFPKVSIKAYGKQLDPSIKYILENLKTDFDFKIRLD